MFIKLPPSFIFNILYWRVLSCLLLGGCSANYYSENPRSYRFRSVNKSGMGVTPIRTESTWSSFRLSSRFLNLADVRFVSIIFSVSKSTILLHLIGNSRLRNVKSCRSLMSNASKRYRSAIQANWLFLPISFDWHQIHHPKIRLMHGRFHTADTTFS